MVHKRFENFERLFVRNKNEEEDDDKDENTVIFLGTKNIMINIHDIYYVEEFTQKESVLVLGLEEAGIPINKLVVLGVDGINDIVVKGNYVDLCRKVKETSRELFSASTN